MITTFLQLYHSPTVITPLPPSLLSRLQQSIRLLVLGTVLDPMPLSITQTAHFRFAATALSIFSPILLMHVPRLDPFSTSPSWAVDSILRRKFLELSIPCLLEIDIK